jgi:hypothetical protein
VNPEQESVFLGTLSECGPTPDPAGGRVRPSADRVLPVVLLVWALCWLAYAAYLYRYSTPLPFCDEWHLAPLAAGKVPLTFSWLWQPENEHRAPLTRLEVVLLGRLASWDLRLVHLVNLALLALGSLALVLAARAVRGRSALSDVFLCLLVLTPCQYQTLLQYAYAYAMALACLCLAAAAVMTGWPLRSRVRLWLYVALALAVTLAGGPAGNLWAIGLCGLFVRGWREGQPAGWKWHALGGSVVLIAVSVTLLLWAPNVPRHAVLRSDSLLTTLQAVGKLAVCWMGDAALKVFYPWAWLALLIPGGYLLGRVMRCARQPAAWVDLAIVLLAAWGVAGLIGYGRGHYANLWDSRYATLLLPIGVLTYLLLVRLQAPPVLTAGLGLWMAVCVGFAWPDAVRVARAWRDPMAAMAQTLRRGEEPLSSVALRFAPALYCADNPAELLDGLVLFREQGLSVFHHNHLAVPGRPLVWEAKSGQLAGALCVVTDKLASKRTAVRASEPGTATYDIEVPAAGLYLLCCRLWPPAPGPALRVCVDGGPPVEQSLPPTTGYWPVTVDPLLKLNAGKHRLLVSLPQAGTKLDVLELVPQAAGRPEGAADRKGEAKDG